MHTDNLFLENNSNSVVFRIISHFQYKNLYKYQYQFSLRFQNHNIIDFFFQSLESLQNIELFQNLQMIFNLKFIGLRITIFVIFYQFLAISQIALLRIQFYH